MFLSVLDDFKPRISQHMCIVLHILLVKCGNVAAIWEWRGHFSLKNFNQGHMLQSVPCDRVRHCLGKWECETHGLWRRGRQSAFVVVLVEIGRIHQTVIGVLYYGN